MQDATAAPCRLSDRVLIVDDEFLIVVELFMQVEDSRHTTTAPFQAGLRMALSNVPLEQPPVWRKGYAFSKKTSAFSASGEAGKASSASSVSVCVNSETRRRVWAP
jgi:hypothetical protein